MWSKCECVQITRYGSLSLRNHGRRQAADVHNTRQVESRFKSHRRAPSSGGAWRRHAQFSELTDGQLSCARVYVVINIGADVVCPASRVDEHTFVVTQPHIAMTVLLVRVVCLRSRHAMITG